MTTRILPGVLAASGSQQYKIEKSIRLNKLDSAGFQKTFSESGNRKTYTMSFWIKPLETVGYIFSDNDGGNNSNFYLYFSSNKLVYWDKRQGTDGSILTTNNVFLDNAAWYHIVLSVNYSATVASDRAKIYINGTEATYSETNYPNTTEDSYWNRANTQYISGGSKINCLLAELNVIDGQSLTPSQFGEIDSATGSWKPKAYAGTYGTNGYYLNFKDSSSKNAIGIDPNKISSARENASVTGSSILSTALSKFGGSSISQPDASSGPVNFRLGAAAGQDYLFEGDFTVEGWVYPSSGPDRSVYVLGDGSTYFALNLTRSGNAFNIYLNSGSPVVTSFTFSDQWYHIALCRSGSASNNVKLFVNGSVIWQTTNNSSVGYTNPVFNRIGGGAGGTGQNVDDFRVYNGTGKYTTTFTPPTSALPIGITDPYWSSVVLAVPADGSNGSTTIPTYYSNYFSPVNISVAPGVNNDSLVDTPTPYGIDNGLGGQVRGNYATIDRNTFFSTTGTLSDSNLKIQGGNDCLSTIGVRSGKWYWESTIEALGTGGDVAHWGIAAIDYHSSENFIVSAIRADYILRRSDISFGSNSSLGSITSITNPSISYNTSVGETLSFQLDLDSTPKTFIAKIGSTTVLNSSFQYNGEKIIYPYFRNNTNSRTVQNFGQRPFLVSAPSGFKALCTQNLSDPVIKKPSNYFDTILWTGNGATSSAGTVGRTISGLGFSPGMIWVKSRTSGTQWDSHNITDVVRGANRALTTDSPGPEVNVATDYGQGGIGSFTSDGFNIVSGTGGGTGNVNGSGVNYVGWAWDTATTVSGNTSGGTSKAYTESYDATSGFSIISYIGNSDENHAIPHSLGDVPDFAMIKERNTAGYKWPIYHRDLPRGNTEAGFTTQNGWIDLSDTAVYNAGDASYIGVSSTAVRLNDVGGSWSNDNNKNYIMYLWKEVPGFSKFGSWNNNNSTNGSFISCDFKPAWIMLKNTDNVENWYILDNKRSSFNSNAPQGAVYLRPNSSGAEFSPTTVALDMYSNGFKIKTTNPASGEISFGTRTYIYAAFAESPFKYSLGR
jgi:hypothetical protein